MIFDEFQNGELPRLGFGFMRLPVLNANDRSTVDLDTVKKMVDLYMSRGFGYFDTAHRYNDEASEPALRKALTERYSRDSYILTNKITLNYIKRAEDQEPFMDHQLEICGVDYFDIYLIHNVGLVSYPRFQQLGTFRFLQEMHAKGKAHHIGISFHGPADLLDEVLSAHPELEFVQLQINYLDWEDPVIQSQKCYEIARKYGKKIVVMEPVKGGTLVNLPDEAMKLMRELSPDSSPASWAIRFAAGLEGVFMVLSGMSAPDQVEDNTAYMKEYHPLSEEEHGVIRKVKDIIRKKTPIACTGCRYCITECPRNIAIPDYFSLYNNLKRLENKSYLANQVVYYGNISATHGKASSCIECGICEKNCPQQLPVRSYLKDVAAALEINLHPPKK